MKKLNAALALCTIAAFAVHTVLMDISLLTGWYAYPVCHPAGMAATVLMSVHAAVSLFIFFFCHDGAAFSGQLLNNIRTVLQRASALLLLLLLHFHMSVYGFIVTGTSVTNGGLMFRIMTEVVYALTLMVHICVSVSKALLSLGIITGPETVKRVDRIAGAVSVIMTAVSVFCIIRFLGGCMQ